MLFTQYAHDCVLLAAETVLGDEGGGITAWNDAGEFTAYGALENINDVSRGDKDTYNATFNVLVDKSVKIHYKDYFRDEAGMTYLVTTEPSFKQTPASASFSLKNFTAKREELP